MGSGISVRQSNNNNGKGNALPPRPKKEKDRKQAYAAPPTVTSDSSQETTIERHKLMVSTEITFALPPAIIFFAPPGYNCRTAVEFVQSKLGIAAIDFQQLMADAPENINLVPYASKETKVLSDRFQMDDCQKGFVLYNFPVSHLVIRQFSEVMDVLLIDSCEIYPVFLEPENHILFNMVRKQWDRWVHMQSGRSYHELSNPPMSMKGLYATVENMYDDITGDKLVKRPEDSFKHYKDLLDTYRHDVLMLKSYFKLQYFAHCQPRDVAVDSSQLHLEMRLCQILRKRSGTRDSNASSKVSMLSKGPSVQRMNEGMNDGGNNNNYNIHLFIH